MKIFLSIASFQDPILKYTIKSALENAKYKDDLVLGVFDQSLEHLDVPSNVRYKTCNPKDCLLYTSPSPRDRQKSRMPSSA